MKRCRLVSTWLSNLQQKRTVLDGAVSSVATVAAFSISIRKKKTYRERHREIQPNKEKNPATPAAVATSPTGTQKTTRQVAVATCNQVATPQAVRSWA